MRFLLFISLIVAPVMSERVSWAYQQTFRCSQCGGILVKCPHCGKFKHVGSRPSPATPAPAFSSPPGTTFVPSSTSSRAVATVATHGTGSAVPPIFTGYPRRPVAVGPSPLPVPVVSSGALPGPAFSPSKPEPGLASVGSVGSVVRQPVPTSPPVSGGRPGVLYKLFGAKKPQQCNGFFAGKHEIGGGMCLFPIGTAEHCLVNDDVSGNPFGGDWITSVEIEGRQYKPVAYTRPPKERRKYMDAAIAVVMGECSGISDDRVYGIDPTVPRAGEEVQFYKSAMWAGIDGSLGYGFRGRAWHALNVAGRKLRSFVLSPLQIAIGEPGHTVEPGDSGLPVTKNNRVVGLVSGEQGEPPFKSFMYFPGEQMKWMQTELLEAFGPDLVTTLKRPVP